MNNFILTLVVAVAGYAIGFNHGVKSVSERKEAKNGEKQDSSTDI